MISGVRASSMRMLSASSTIGEIVGALDGQLCLHGGSPRAQEGLLERLAVGVAELEPLQLVAEEVEAEFLAGAVGDVAGVGAPRERVGLPGLDAADRQPQQLVDRRHPFGVAAGQVVVDRDDVHALARQGIEERGQGGDQGLAFAGLELGDARLWIATPPTSWTSKCRWPIVRLAASRTSANASTSRQLSESPWRCAKPQIVRPVLQLVVREGFKSRLHVVDSLDTNRANLLNRPAGVGPVNCETRFSHIEPRRLAMVLDLLLSHHLPACARARRRVPRSDDLFHSQ